MSADRPFAHAMPFHQAITELRRGPFDPVVVAAAEQTSQREARAA
jgi:hypothetical protein